MMRLFITVNMSQEIRDQVTKALPLIKCRFDGKFVPMDHWHITTLFLGEVDEKKIPLIEQAMKTAVRGMILFPLWIEGIGAFPSMKKPNILWGGVKGELQSFNQLYQQLIRAIEPLQIDFDAKPVFTPHLTLARKVRPKTCDENSEIQLKTTHWVVDGLELYQSTFINQGVKYHRVFKTNF
ncbi:RNA 2',3'-cyclic phosphodiesterase [Tepidibacillus marianensis]|uniref:RNA 2',3'-cyclic phosphodiesterase n=1 Tax=Tepidibacillus marianensis TaxID=3131995 RepID=UPI0030D3FA6C